MIYVSKGDKIFADDDFSRIGGVLDPFVVTWTLLLLLKFSAFVSILWVSTADQIQRRI